MNIRADKTQENNSHSVSHPLSHMQNSGESTFQFVDNRPETIVQRKLQDLANNRPDLTQNTSKDTTVQMRKMSGVIRNNVNFRKVETSHSHQPIQMAFGRIGINPTYQSLMVFGNNKLWYNIREGINLPDGTDVEFDPELRDESAPPGIYWASNVREEETTPEETTVEDIEKGKEASGISNTKSPISSAPKGKWGTRPNIIPETETMKPKIIAPPLTRASKLPSAPTNPANTNASPQAVVEASRLIDLVDKSLDKDVGKDLGSPMVASAPQDLHNALMGWNNVRCKARSTFSKDVRYYITGLMRGFHITLHLWKDGKDTFETIVNHHVN